MSVLVLGGIFSLIGFSCLGFVVLFLRPRKNWVMTLCRILWILFSVMAVCGVISYVYVLYNLFWK